jgi:hypothetical protein
MEFGDTAGWKPALRTANASLRPAVCDLSGLKGALALSGICDDFMAEPFQRFRDPERARLRQILEELTPLLTR